jgi:hypothetical protein
VCAFTLCYLTNFLTLVVSLFLFSIQGWTW